MLRSCAPLRQFFPIKKKAKAQKNARLINLIILKRGKILHLIGCNLTDQKQALFYLKLITKRHHWLTGWKQDGKFWLPNYLNNYNCLIAKLISHSTHSLDARFAKWCYFVLIFLFVFVDTDSHFLWGKLSFFLFIIIWWIEVVQRKYILCIFKALTLSSFLADFLVI